MYLETLLGIKYERLVQLETAAVAYRRLLSENINFTSHSSDVVTLVVTNMRSGLRRVNRGKWVTMNTKRPFRSELMVAILLLSSSECIVVTSSDQPSEKRSKAICVSYLVIRG